MGELFRPIPHRVVDDGDLVLLIGIRPSSILLNYLQGIVTPNGSMTGGDDVDGKIQLHNLFNLALHQ